MSAGRKRLLLTLGLLGLPLWLAAQTVNLVEMKKQEEERRKRLDKSKIVVTDTNLGELQAAAGTKPYGIVEAQPGDAPAAEAAAGTPPPPAGPEVAPPPEQTAAYWQEQKAALDQRIAALQQALVDDQVEINRLRFRYMQTGLANEQLALNQQIREMETQMGADQAALDEARTGLEDLLERARKLRVPRAWLD